MFTKTSISSSQEFLKKALDNSPFPYSIKIQDLHAQIRFGNTVIYQEPEQKSDNPLEIILLTLLFDLGFSCYLSISDLLRLRKKLVVEYNQKQFKTHYRQIAEISYRKNNYFKTKNLLAEKSEKLGNSLFEAKSSYSILYQIEQILLDKDDLPERLKILQNFVKKRNYDMLEYFPICVYLQIQTFRLPILSPELSKYTDWMRYNPIVQKFKYPDQLSDLLQISFFYCRFAKWCNLLQEEKVQKSLFKNNKSLVFMSLIMSIMPFLCAIDLFLKSKYRLHLFNIHDSNGNNLFHYACASQNSQCFDFVCQFGRLFDNFNLLLSEKNKFGFCCTDFAELELKSYISNTYSEISFSEKTHDHLTEIEPTRNISSVSPGKMKNFMEHEIREPKISIMSLNVNKFKVIAHPKLLKELNDLLRGPEFPDISFLTEVHDKRFPIPDQFDICTIKVELGRKFAIIYREDVFSSVCVNKIYWKCQKHLNAKNLECEWCLLMNKASMLRPLISLNCDYNSGKFMHRLQFWIVHLSAKPDLCNFQLNNFPYTIFSPIIVGDFNHNFIKYPLNLFPFNSYQILPCNDIGTSQSGNTIDFHLLPPPFKSKFNKFNHFNRLFSETDHLGLFSTISLSSFKDSFISEPLNINLLNTKSIPKDLLIEFNKLYESKWNTSCNDIYYFQEKYNLFEKKSFAYRSRRYHGLISNYPRQQEKMYCVSETRALMVAAFISIFLALADKANQIGLRLY